MRRSWRSMVRMHIVCAADTLQLPLRSSSTDDAAHMKGIYAALRIALEADAQGLMLDAASEEGDNDRLVAGFLLNLLRCALSEDGPGLLRQLRATCGMTRDEEAALRRLAQRADDVCMRGCQTTSSFSFEERVAESAFSQLDEQRKRAAADAARHGLRACALPECGATEPHPKTFKLCGRCGRVAYCSKEHQQQDWRRHKREDSCKAAA